MSNAILSKDNIFIFTTEENTKSLKGNFKNNPDNTFLSPYILVEKYLPSLSSTQIIELEISIDAFEFIQKLHLCELKFKAITAKFLRSIIISGVNELAQIGDIHYSLKKLTSDLKYIHYIDDPCRPGVNAGICVVEYETHQAARNALNILNNTTISNYYYRVINGSKTLQAYWGTAEGLKVETSVYFFENLNVNTYNVFHLKAFLEKSFERNVMMIRQYGQKVLVEFNKPISSKSIVYENRNLGIVQAMRPNSNIHRYREKVQKILPYHLTEHDRRLLISVCDESIHYYSDGLRRKAEYLLSSKNNHEYISHKRDRRERDDSREKRKEKDRDYREGRDKDYGRDIRDNRDNRGDRRNKSDDYRRKKDYSREREYGREISKDRSKHREKEETQSSSTTSTSNNNIMTQLASLLLNNANSFQGLTLSNLANINTLLTNPGLLNTIQQLTNLQGNGPNTTTSNQSTQQGGNAMMKPTPMSPNVMMQSPGNFSKVSEVTNINQLTSPSTTPQNYYNPNYIQQPMKQQYYQGQPYPYNPEYYIQGYNPIDPNSQQNLDNDSMKKYYEYLQSLNK
jgi:hypothetical protein